MGNTKFDLIATSQKKGYRIAMVIVIVLGILLIGVSLIMRLSVTQAVMPNKLQLVDLPNCTGTNSNFTATITQHPVYLAISTGTKGKALAQPITFTLDDDAAKFLKPIPDAYHDNKPFLLETIAGAPSNTTGILTIRCGSMKPITILITYEYAV